MRSAQQQEQLDRDRLHTSSACPRLPRRAGYIAPLLQPISATTLGATTGSSVVWPAMSGAAWPMPMHGCMRCSRDAFSLYFPPFVLTSHFCLWESLLRNVIPHVVLGFAGLLILQKKSKKSQFRIDNESR
ncbi:Nuclear protein localization protein 4 [Frankliniella fusca]|uniref:Nuclear protein localization protein 4 n=1 Tax=Frankliniella fusca TaxID=407009 RepID=A0AAE1HGD9_9NEOP|nr:Nuclear protein localization protein 4 [Frankliniella fusca]